MNKRNYKNTEEPVVLTYNSAYKIICIYKKTKETTGSTTRHAYYKLVLYLIQYLKKKITRLFYISVLCVCVCVNYRDLTNETEYDITRRVILEPTTTRTNKKANTVWVPSISYM